MLPGNYNLGANKQKKTWFWKLSKLWKKSKLWEQTDRLVSPKHKYEIMDSTSAEYQTTEKKTLKEKIVDCTRLLHGTVDKNAGIN